MKKLVLLSLICLGIEHTGSAQVLAVVATPPGMLFGTLTTSINEINLDKAIKVFPNPAENEVNIVTVDGYSIGKCDVLIYDAKGRLVLTEKDQNFQSKIVTVDVQGLTNGLYTMTIKTENKAVINRKFVISK